MYNTIFLTGKDVAEVLKISKALAYRLIANGEIQAVRFGRTVRVKKDDLDAFIQRNSPSQSTPGTIQVQTGSQMDKSPKKTSGKS